MIRLPYGVVDAREPVVYVHRFGTRDTKTEQRFYAGPGERRLRVSLDDLAPDERTELVDQFEAASGSLDPFTIDLVLPTGSTETLTVRFVSPRLEVQTLVDGSRWTAAFELVVDPGTAPSYTSSSTVTRFPDGTLQTALLSPVQEMIPLIVITPKSGSAVRCSDRACTVDGTDYMARLLDWAGIRQSLYGADQATLTFANADRYWTTAVNTINWHAADVQFALLHVGTLKKINLWRGHIVPGGWTLTREKTFRVTAADGAYELRLAYPPRKVTRQEGFVTPTNHQPVNLGRGRKSITATSVVHDTGYGRPLKDIWVNDSTAPLKVACDVIAGRDEREFYAALGIVGRGPIGDFGSVPIIEGGSAVHYGTLDGQPNHGPGLYGIRRSRGGNASTGSETQIDNNPDSGSDILAIDETGSPLPAQPAPAGAAFLQIRRKDEPGIQPDNAIKEHEMIAFVSQGNGGYTWSGGVRSWTPALTNLAWVAVNVWLRGRGVGAASQATQETYFVVAAAEAFAAVCETTVDALVGAGTEKQFQFTGIIAEEKPLRDWLKEILAAGLGYFTFEFGKLKLGSRFHSGASEAFDAGNILLNTLDLNPTAAEFNHLTATFADREYGYQSNSLEFGEEDHIAALGQTTKATINLPGCCTKSQAARLVTSLVREQLGGADAAEWAIARQIRFSTTVLALNVDCGTICSLTHEEMPTSTAPGATANYGEFIVEGWELNKDLSISIEGRTTTDKMYDYVYGNKPTDVPVNLPPGQTDKLPGLFLYTPVVKDLGFLTLTDCSITDGSNRGLRSATVFLIYVDQAEPDNWVTLDSSLGTGDPATFNVTPNGTVSFAVDDYVFFDDAGKYEISKITAKATNTWTLQRSWPGNDPGEAIFESLRESHTAGTRIYKAKVQKFTFSAAGGTFEDADDTTTIAPELPCQLSEARVVAVSASAANGYGFSDWVVTNLGAGLNTDSMADYLTRATAPGAVTIVVADYEYIDAYRVRVRIFWTAPTPLEEFKGVHCWEENPDVSSIETTSMDGTQAMDGSSNLGGEWAPIDRGRGVESPFTVELDAPTATTTHRFYLSSYSTGAEAALVRATDPSPTPSVTLAIAPAAYQSGVEYAQLVTGAVASIEYDDTQVASPKYRLRFQCAAPTIAPAAWQRGFGGYQIVYEYEDGSRANGPSFAVNELDSKSDWYDLYVGSSIVRCWFVSYDNSEQPRLNSIVAGVTPMSEVTVVWPLASRPPEAIYADNVTAFAVSNPRYVINGQGQKVFLLDWSWVRPATAEAMARWGGSTIYLLITGDPQPYQITGAEQGAAGTMEFGQFPSSPTLWTFYAISQDNNGNANTTAADPISGTPSVAITVNPPTVGAAGTEYTSNVTSPSFAVAGITASDGTTPQRITATFTRPTDVTWGGVEMRVYDGATLVAKVSGAASPIAVTIPNPTTSTTYTVKLVSFDVNGQSNTETAGTPQGTVLAGSTAGTLDLRKFLPASTDNFAIVGSVLQVKTGVAITVDGSGNLRVQPSGITSSLIAAGAVDNAALAALSVDVTKITDNAISTPKLTAGAVTTAKIAAAAVTAAEIAAGAIVAGKIAANAVTANEIAADAVTATKILAGSVTAGKVAANAISSDKLDAIEINVGGGGSKPGKFGVYNASGVQVGFIGVESGNEGAWFKTCRIGGSSYATGVFRADASGNVVIDGATFALSLNGVTTEITNVLDNSDYSGLRVKRNSAPNTRVLVTPDDIFMLDNGGGIPFYVTNNGTAGYLEVRHNSLSRICQIDPQNARVQLLNMELTVQNFIETLDEYRVNGVRVVEGRKAAIGSASTSHSTGGGGTVDAALNALGTLINTIVARLGATSGHGLTSD